MNRADDVGNNRYTQKAEVLFPFHGRGLAESKHAQICPMDGHTHHRVDAQSSLNWPVIKVRL